MITLILHCLLPPALLQAETVSPRPLRIYYQQREQLNPLNTFDLSGEALMQLCYRGLFRMNDSAGLEYDLAESAEWSADHLALRIRLKPDLRFSDQRALNAKDAAMSILYRRYYLQNLHGEEEIPTPTDAYLENAAPESLATIPEATAGEAELTGDQPLAEGEGDEESEYAAFSRAEQSLYFDSLRTDPDGLETLKAIQSITVEDEYNLLIQLSERAERLPWVLRFAVIPAEHVESSDQTIIPGTGRYLIRKWREDGSLLLQAQSGNGTAEIEVIPAEDEDHAFILFSEGKLDVLLLSADQFPERSLRQDLRYLRQESLIFRCLIAGNHGEFAFASAELREAFRSWLLSWPGGGPLQGTMLMPFHSRDWRLRNLQIPPAFTGETAALDRLQRLLEGRELTLAAPARGEVRTLMDRLTERLSVLGCAIQVRYLTEEEYQDFARSGTYDLLYWECVMSYPTDARCLRNELGALAPTQSFALPDIFDDRYIAPAFFYRFAIREDESEQESVHANLQATVDSLFASALFPLGFKEQGVFLGSAVEGSLNSPSWDPYRGLETLICR